MIEKAHSRRPDDRKGAVYHHSRVCSVSPVFLNNLVSIGQAMTHCFLFFLNQSQSGVAVSETHSTPDADLLSVLHVDPVTPTEFTVFRSFFFFSFLFVFADNLLVSILTKKLYAAMISKQLYSSISMLEPAQSNSCTRVMQLGDGWLGNAIAWRG